MEGNDGSVYGKQWSNDKEREKKINQGLWFKYGQKNETTTTMLEFKTNKFDTTDSCSNPSYKSHLQQMRVGTGKRKSEMWRVNQICIRLQKAR